MLLGVLLRMATSRDDVLKMLNDEISAIGVASTVEKGYAVALLAGIGKRVITATSKHHIVEWLNKEHRRCGADMQHLVVEAYGVIKDVEF